MQPKQRIVFEFSPEQCEEFLETLRACKELLENSKTPVSEPEFIGIEEAMAITHLTKAGIDKKASKGEIPHYKMNRKRYYKRAELIAWIESGKRGPDNNQAL